MSDISKINPGNGTTYTIKDASAVSNLSVSGTNLTVTRRNNTTFTVSLPADEKVKVSTSTTNARFPLMAIATSSVTNEKSYQAIYDSGIVINPNIHSIAEGTFTEASGWYSHAEGYLTTASGYYSHAEGYNTRAWADGAHAEGIGTIADKEAMTAIGKYNNTAVGNIDGDYLFVVGNGTSTSSRSNAFAVTANGITATSLSVTNATVSTMTVSTINGVTVGTPQFTDTKVTSADNHYTPSEDSSFVADATGATGTWGIDVVKGVKILKDSKGHVTGLEVVSGKIPANPVSANTVTTTGTLSTDKLVLGAGNNKTIKTTSVGIGTGTFNATPDANTVATELGVKNYINGQLTGAMHFVGITSTTMSDNQTTNPTVSGHTTFTAGDVVIDPTETEFIYDGSTTPKWHKLGDAKSYALASNVVNNITVKGDTWITPSPTTSQKGIVTVTLSHKTLTSYSAKGTTTKVPQITTDGAGHVTSITEQNIAFPSITISTSGSGNVISDLTTSGHKITITKSNITVTDTKQSISASTGKVYLTGVTSTSITGVGYSNGNVYMSNGNLNALGLSVTTATISTLNGKAVGNNPQFTDTVYTHPGKTQSDTTSTAKPSHGGSFTVVDGVTRDGLGHVSGINVKTVTLPASGNTDEKVKVSTSTPNNSYPLMAVNSTGPSNGGTYGAICNTGITMNPYIQLVSVSGKVNAAGGFFQTSDINKKNIIGDLDLDKAYDLIDKCQTILYTLKDDDSDKELIGLIAQEVKEFFPELITEDNDGALSLDYSRLTVVILKVLKDIINRIKILESK